MIIGSLPFIMFGVIYLIDPATCMKLFTDPRGWMLLAPASRAWASAWASWARWSGSRYEPARAYLPLGPHGREPVRLRGGERSPSSPCSPLVRAAGSPPLDGPARAVTRAPAASCAGGAGGRPPQPPPPAAYAAVAGADPRADPTPAAAAERPDRAHPQQAAARRLAFPGRDWHLPCLKLASPSVFGFVAFLLVYGLHVGDRPDGLPAVVLVVRCCWAFSAPDIYLSRHRLPSGALALQRRCPMASTCW